MSSYQYRHGRRRHAIERTRRPPNEVARPTCLHDGRAGRQYGEGGSTPQNRSACSIEINRRSGAYARCAPARQGVEPTPYGRALLDCGVTVFDDLRRGVRDLEFLADPTAGQVRIGCNPFLAAGFVSAVVD